MQIRRVVTGHDDNSNSVFASDKMVAPVAAGTWVMSACDETPHFQPIGLHLQPTRYPALRRAATARDRRSERGRRP